MSEKEVTLKRLDEYGKNNTIKKKYKLQIKSISKLNRFLEKKHKVKALPARKSTPIGIIKSVSISNESSVLLFNGSPRTVVEDENIRNSETPNKANYLVPLLPSNL